MQGFYSPSSTDKSWQASWGTEGDGLNEVKASLFGNDVSVKLHHHGWHIRKRKTLRAIANKSLKQAILPLTACGSVTGLLLRMRFSALSPDNYRNTVNCYVTDDGRLRIGVKMAGAELKAAWALFDHFEVEYLGAGRI